MNILILTCSGSVRFIRVYTSVLTTLKYSSLTMEVKTFIVLTLLFVLCQLMNTDGGSRNSLKSFRKCLEMPAHKPASKRAILNYIRRNFALVPLSYASASPQDINTSFHSVPRRVPRALAPGGHCPYTIKKDDVLNRIPRLLIYASCGEEVCSPALCKPVMYSHKVLIQKCDGVWEWSEKTLPVAFIRRP